MPLNISNITAPTDFPNLLQVANDLSEGVYGFGLLLALFAIVFINIKARGYSAMDAALSGFFVFILVGYLFVGLALITVGQMLLPTLGFIGMVVFVMLQKQRRQY